MNIEQLLQQAQEAPDDYFGPLCDLVEDNLARTGLVISRDSEPEDELEWTETYTYLKGKYGEAHVTTYRSSHWAVGWTEEIIVTARDAEGNIYPAFVEAIKYNEGAMNALQNAE